MAHQIAYRSQHAYLNRFRSSGSQKFCRHDLGRLNRFFRLGKFIGKPFIFHTDHTGLARSFINLLLRQCGIPQKAQFIKASDIQDAVVASVDPAQAICAKLDKNKVNVIYGWSGYGSGKGNNFSAEVVLAILAEADLSEYTVCIVMHADHFRQMYHPARESYSFETIGCYTEEYYIAHRERMIEEAAIELGRVRLPFDPRLEVLMRALPRQEFVPDAWRGFAYDDGIISWHEFAGQIPSSVTRLTTHAKMLSWLKIKPGQRVFELGTGSGYQAALLAGMVSDGSVTGRVITAEWIAALSMRAKVTLASLGINNVQCHVGDGIELAQHFGKFDRIVVAAGVLNREGSIKLTRALVDGGIMIVPEGDYSLGGLNMYLYQKRGNLLTRRLLETGHSFVPCVSTLPQPMRPQPPDQPLLAQTA